jgi:hypothetical protein
MQNGNTNKTIDRKADSIKKREFLMACATEAKPLETIMREHDVKVGDFVRWYRSKAFRAKLRDILAAHRGFVMLTMSLEAVVGSSLLTSASFSDGAVIKPTQLPGINDATKYILRPVRASRARRKSPTGQANRRGKGLQHPNLSEEQARRLRDDLECGWRNLPKPGKGDSLESN